MANLHFKYCDTCKAVKQTYPDPECSHFGKVQRNTESVMVIFRGPDGKVSIPWSDKTKTPEGFVREEVRGAKAVRKLERELDAKDLARHHQYQEKMERFMEPINNSVREGLKRQRDNARHPFERDLAAAALARMDRGYSQNFDAGNHRSE